MLRQSCKSVRFVPRQVQHLTFVRCASTSNELDEFDQLLAEHEELRADRTAPTTGIVAAVFGATGFVGKYLIQRLGDSGSQIIIPYRGTENVFRHLRPLGDIGQVVPIACDVWKPEQLHESMSQANLVINLIGKRWATKNFSLDDVNHKIPAQIAAAAKELDIPRMIHVSALEARPTSISEFGRTKYLGEQAVRDIYPDATIIRPSSVFGYEDRLLNKWASILKRWLISPDVDALAARKEGPVSALDLASAIQKCVFDASTIGQTYELQGPQITHRELLELIREISYLEPSKLQVPVDVLMGISKGLEFFPYPTITVDEWRSLLHDNLAESEAKGFSDLKIDPLNIRSEAVKVLRYYRKSKLINEL